MKPAWKNNLAIFLCVKLNTHLPCALVSTYKLKGKSCIYTVGDTYKDAYFITVDKGKLLEANPNTYQKSLVNVQQNLHSLEY